MNYVYTYAFVYRIIDNSSQTLCFTNKNKFHVCVSVICVMCNMRDQKREKKQKGQRRFTVHSTVCLQIDFMAHSGLRREKNAARMKCGKKSAG